MCLAVGYILGLIPEEQVRRLSKDEGLSPATGGSAGDAPAATTDAEAEALAMVMAKRMKANDPTASFNKVVDAFQYFDKNGDGFIEKDEMESILREDGSGDYKRKDGKDQSRRENKGSKREGGGSARDLLSSRKTSGAVGGMAAEILSKER